MTDSEVRSAPGEGIVRFRRLESNLDLPLPVRATPQAAGYDVRAATAVDLAPGAIELVPTGLVMELPEGVECQVRPRSGLALKHGLTLPNSPGTVDRRAKTSTGGELGIIDLLENRGHGQHDMVHPWPGVTGSHSSSSRGSRLPLLRSLTTSARPPGRQGASVAPGRSSGAICFSGSQKR